MRLALALALVLGAATVAAAAPEDDAAALFGEGQRHYDLAEYDLAIASFKAGYAIVQEPLFLFNIAQAYRQLGDCDDARRFYKSFLRNVPAGEDPDEQDKATKFVEHMDGCKVTAPTPDPTPVLRPDPPPVSVAPAPPRSHTLRWIGVASGGAGAVMLGASGVLAWRAASASRDLEAMCMPTCDVEDIEARDAAGRTDATRALVLGAVGGVALLAGAALVVLDLSRAEPAAEHLAIAPLPGGGAAVTGRWAF